MTAPSIDLAPPKVPLWNDPKFRSWIAQALAVALLAWLAYDLYANASANLARLNKTFGYEFWNRSAGFDIIQSLVPYTSASSYGRAILVGFLNTVLVSVLGIIFATIIGFIVGISRLSSNWLIAKLAAVYVEVIRNVPLLLQIFIWYGAVLKPLPGPKQAVDLGGIAFLSNRGLVMPRPEFGEGAWLGLVGLIAGIACALLLRRWAMARQAATGEAFPYTSTGLAIILALPLLGLALAGWPVTFDFPKLGGFNFQGGATILPEFIALLLALSIYTASFIAEIVRSGIQAVARGQSEAALALGLRQGSVTRLVVMPQALRVIIPPLASQYLNLTKNSSLAVAIAYPDLVATGGTVLNQTGKAIEVVLVWMAVYLSLSLLTSAFMNWFNARARLVER
jgi:general L-amino acid transport system permease protein